MINIFSGYRSGLVDGLVHMKQLVRVECVFFLVGVWGFGGLIRLFHIAEKSWSVFGNHYNHQMKPKYVLGYISWVLLSYCPCKIRQFCFRSYCSSIKGSCFRGSFPHHWYAMHESVRCPYIQLDSLHGGWSCRRHPDEAWHGSVRTASRRGRTLGGI